MKKVIGYLLAGLGLVGMFLSSSAGMKLVPYFENFDRLYVLIPALILVALGVIILIVSGDGLFSRGGGRVKQAEKEVPIYRGEGKKRKIVGYKREK